MLHDSIPKQYIHFANIYLAIKSVLTIYQKKSNFPTVNSIHLQFTFDDRISFKM